MRALRRLQVAIRDSTSSRRVALGRHRSLFGEDAPAESKETEILPPRKRDSAPACGFTPHPGDPGGGGAFHQSSIDAADVDRAGQRNVFEQANVSAPLPLDRFAANS